MTRAPPSTGRSSRAPCRRKRKYWPPGTIRKAKTSDGTGAMQRKGAILSRAKARSRARERHAPLKSSVDPRVERVAESAGDEDCARTRERARRHTLLSSRASWTAEHVCNRRGRQTTHGDTRANVQRARPASPGQAGGPRGRALDHEAERPFWARCLRPRVVKYTYGRQDRSRGRGRDPAGGRTEQSTDTRGASRRALF
jgi:hypothetical protein